MAVRNFWMEGYVDGRDTTLSGGPRSKDGGMEIVIRQRDAGKSVKAFTISSCIDYVSKNLVTYVKDSEGNVVSKFETKR